MKAKQKKEEMPILKLLEKAIASLRQRSGIRPPTSLANYQLLDTAPTVQNQCDGCQAGYPVKNGVHHIPYPSGPMACEKEVYQSAELGSLKNKT